MNVMYRTALQRSETMRTELVKGTYEIESNREGLDSVSVESLFCVHYDTTEEMVSEIVAGNYPSRSDHQFDGRDNTGWFGRSLNGTEHAVTLESEAWAEGLDTVRKMADRLMARLPAPKSARRRQRWSEDGGDDVCNDRLRSGQSFWRTTQREMLPSQTTVTIVTEMSTLADISPENALWRGAVSVAMTELLEEAGYRVELIAATIVWDAYSSIGQQKTGSSTLLHTVTMKRPDQPVDISNLTNWVSAWAYRSLWFSSRAVHGHHFSRELGISGYVGSPDILPLITRDERPIVIGAVWSEDDAVSRAFSEMERVLGLEAVS